MVLVEAEGREVESRRTQQLSNEPQRPQPEPSPAGAGARAGGRPGERVSQPAAPPLLPAGCPAGRGSAWTMPILLFLIDTSASMNQRAYLGTSYLDIAKGAVEIFMKVSAGPRGPPPTSRSPPFARSRCFSPLSLQLRARDPASRGDRYMLVTFDEPPYCIKVITAPPPPPRNPPPPPRARRGAALGVAAARRSPRPARRRQQQPVKMADILLLYGGERAEGAAEMEEEGGGGRRRRTGA